MCLNKVEFSVIHEREGSDNRLTSEGGWEGSNMKSV